MAEAKAEEGDEDEAEAKAEAKAEAVELSLLPVIVQNRCPNQCHLLGISLLYCGHGEINCRKAPAADGGPKHDVASYLSSICLWSI